MISLTTVRTVKHERTRERQRAQSRMQEIDERQIDRHPWQVEQRRRPLAAEKAADRIDVASAFESFGGGETETRHVDCHAVRQRRHLPVEPRADAHQHLGADDVEAALEEIQADDQARKDEKRRDAAAGQRPVVDLHHVHRSGQRQHVDHPGDQEQEQHDAAEAAGEFRKVTALCGS